MFLFIPSTTFFVLTQEKQEQARDWGAECDSLRCVTVAGSLSLCPGNRTFFKTSPGCFNE